MPFKFSLLFCSLIISIHANAQLPKGLNNLKALQTFEQSSEEDFKGYIQQAKAAGYSLNEVKSLMRSKGASSNEIRQIELLWKELSSSGSIENQEDLDEFQSNFGIKFPFSSDDEDAIEGKDVFSLEKKRFGSDFFRFKQPVSEVVPQLYIATPADYQLGPGDEIDIFLFGASEISYNLRISREGYIKVDRLAPVYLSGLSISAARDALTKRFASIYNGLSVSNDDPSKVYLDLSLKSSRSVVVNIIGQVENPGTYTLSSFTSVINALYAAGGPNDIGSYRTVNLIRNGQIINEIDLYKFFAGGKLAPIYLQDQDVIQVPSLSSQVELRGAFKTPGYYEIRKDETLADVLYFSGGFLSDAYKEKVFVNRIMEYNRKSLTFNVVEGSFHLLKDGDILEATLVEDETKNAVVLEGAVYVPGTYSLDIVNSIADLLDAAGGLSRSAVKGQATLFRLSNGVEREALSVDLKDESQLNYQLKDGDRLFIPSEIDIYDAAKIRVQGEVNNPGEFMFQKGMSLSDALVLAGGFTSNADKLGVSVYQNFLFEGETFTQTEKVAVEDNLVTQKPVLLQENSLIVVRKNPDFREVEQVYLSGLVLKEGIYALKGNNYRLYDLLQDSGGFLKDAYLKGISVKRALGEEDSNDFEIVQTSILEGIESTSDRSVDKTDVVEKKNEIEKEINTESVIIGIDGDKLIKSKGSDLNENIILQKGDSINVPRLDNTITILGEIQKKSKVVFEENITVKKAIRYAGGFNEKAKSSRVYVIYKNGTIKSRRKLFGLISYDPKLEPGATVVVPERLYKEDKNVSLGEIAGLTSSLATLLLLVQQLGL